MIRPSAAARQGGCGFDELAVSGIRDFRQSARPPGSVFPTRGLDADVH